MPEPAHSEDYECSGPAPPLPSSTLSLRQNQTYHRPA